MTSLLEVAKNVRSNTEEGEMSALELFEKMSKDELGLEEEDDDYGPLDDEEERLYHDMWNDGPKLIDDDFDGGLAYENAFMKVIKKCVEAGFPIDAFVLCGVSDSIDANRHVFAFENEAMVRFKFVTDEENDSIALFDEYNRPIRLKDLM